jgi:hypothetical protein
LRTATAWWISLDSRGPSRQDDGEESDCAYLLDEVVQVLRDLGGKACRGKNHSVSLVFDQAEA